MDPPPSFLKLGPFRVPTVAPTCFPTFLSSALMCPLPNLPFLQPLPPSPALGAFACSGWFQHRQQSARWGGLGWA